MTSKTVNNMPVLRTKLLYGIIILLLISLSCNLPLVTAPPVSQEPDQAAIQLNKLDLLEKDSKIKPEMYFQNGFPSSVLVKVPASGANTVEMARSYLEEYRGLYLQSNPDLALNVLRTSGKNDENVIFYQTYKKLPVFMAEINVLISGSEIQATIGSLLNSDINLDIMPALSSIEAEAFARAAVQQPKVPVNGKTTLMIFDKSLFSEDPASPHLAWKVTLNDKNYWQVFIDAKTGDTLFKHSLIENGDYDYEEWDANGENAYDTNCYWDAGPHSIGDEDSLDDDYSGDIDAVKAHDYAKQAFFFYHDTFGRETENFGGQIEVGIHANVDNALWRGNCDIAEFANGWVGYDVMVHEFGHGIIAHSTMLKGFDNPGALNESFADIMGVYADSGDWLVGEDRTNGQGAIRDLSNPPRNKMTDYKYDANDNGGVHANSTIISKAAYLLGCDNANDMKCGFHNGWEVSPIGLNKTAVLFYQTFTSVLPSDANFYNAAAITTKMAEIWAANGTAGFTKDDACQVRNAFAAIGLLAGDFGCDGTIDNAFDTDGDYIPDKDDNCPKAKNPIQFDTDHDGKGNACDDDDDNDHFKDNVDNCSLIPNPTQKDVDHDGIGDACDDSDGDGIRDDTDNCINVKNPSQIDTDGDKQGDACDDDYDGDGVQNERDNCAYDSNPDQKDTDHDGEGDVCDTDSDMDGISNDHDNCPFTPNPGQENSDGDGAGDACDPTPICKDVEAWSTGYQIGEEFIFPQPLANPLACTPESVTPSIELKPGIKIDGVSQNVDISGNPGGHIILPLPDCQPDQDGWFSPDRRALFTLEGLGHGVMFRIVDSDGNRQGKETRVSNTAQNSMDAPVQVLIQPLAGQHDFLDLLFPADFPPGNKLSFGTRFICGPKVDLTNLMIMPAAAAVINTAEPVLKTATAAVTPSASFTPVPAGACTWTAAINIFVRQGPGSSSYTDVWSFTPGQSAPVVGQSPDGFWWVVETPAGNGYVPKAPRFGSSAGMCDGLKTFDPPPTITPTPGLLVPVPAVLPQCNDRIDNDGDGRIDMDDSQCRNKNDNNEAVP
ncbi:MAG: thrombospondin type 3 repeat-containing protein [Chloroflexota bacterium]